MVYKTFFKNVNSVVLENDLLKVIVIPSIGGKLASIYNKTSQFELLFQNKENEYKAPYLSAPFAEFDAAGFDDAFPTIDASIVIYEGKEIIYPDHGEIWSANFNYEILNNELKLKFTSAILPYTYEKTVSISNDSVIIKYAIKNTGKSPFPCIWAMHCLVNCTEDMEISFPEGTTEILNVHESTNLGQKNSVHKYPVTKTTDNKDYKLNRVGSPSLNNTEKYYVNGIAKCGNCSINYQANHTLYTIDYDKNIMPYLGFWVTEGGFRGDYNCALEPTNGFYDDIETAEKNNKLFYLKPDEALNFEICLGLKAIK